MIYATKNNDFNPMSGYFSPIIASYQLEINFPGGYTFGPYIINEKCCVKNRQDLKFTDGAIFHRVLISR